MRLLTRFRAWRRARRAERLRQYQAALTERIEARWAAMGFTVPGDAQEIT